MDSNWTPGRRYRLVLRGELGDSFGFLFEGMRLQRLAGTTVLTGQVTDQAHLLGLIEQIQELGVELVSVNPDQGTDGGAAVLGRNPAGHDGSSARPQNEFACADGCASQSGCSAPSPYGTASTQSHAPLRRPHISESLAKK